MKTIAAILACISILIVFITLAVALYLPTHSLKQQQRIASFEDCAKAGYPVMESYPAQCRTPDGTLFVQVISSPTLEPTPLSDSSDMIRITTPQAGQSVTDPFTVTGEARGSWFFEGSFPISVEDTSGTIVVTTHAQAQGEWMTTDFVPFQVEIDIPDTVIGPAVVIIEKDNPSGLPEHAASVRIPIIIGSESIQPVF